MIDVIKSGGFEIPVVYEDNHLLVVVKPPNLLSQADNSRDDDLLSILKRYIGHKYNKPGNVYLGLVHRLDRPVGGLMVLARTSKAAARLSADFAAHAQNKRYLAVLRGELNAKLELADHLKKNADSGMVEVVSENAAGAKLARLETAPIITRNGLTLAEVTLFTGRSHQIRVQHAHAGYPLWGDNRYGNGKPGEQIALFAYRLGLMHPTRKEPLDFAALPPETGAWSAFYDIIKEKAAQ